jgi:hypothetical protein
VKLSKISREKATFKYYHGKGSTTFQHKLKKVQWKDKSIEIFNYCIEGRKGAAF